MWRLGVRYTASHDSRLPELNKLTSRNSTTKIQHKGQVTIPTRVRTLAGLSKGDLVEFSFQRGKIVITPKLIIDRSRFSNADDEYTPAQRRLIDARLDKAMEEVRTGQTYGPFETHEEMMKFLNSQAKKARGKKTNKPKTR